MQEQQEKKTKKWKKSLKVLMQTFEESQIRIYSVLITYYLLLSFFPLLIAIGNILPHLNFNSDKLIPYIKELLPNEVYNTLKGTIGNLLTKSSNGLLSLSAIGTLWALSKVINAIRLSLDQAYNVKRGKFQLSRRLFSILMVFILFFGIFSLMLIIGFGQAILEYILPVFGLPNEILEVFMTLKWPVTAIVLFIILLMLYYFVPSAKVHFKTIVPGAIFTTICWMCVTQFYGFYVNNFLKRISSYGVIGGFIFFILWLNVAATLIIAGGVINVTCEKLVHGEIRIKASPIGNYVKKKMVLKRKEKEEG